MVYLTTVLQLVPAALVLLATVMLALDHYISRTMSREVRIAGIDSVNNVLTIKYGAEKHTTTMMLKPPPAPLPKSPTLTHALSRDPVPLLELEVQLILKQQGRTIAKRSSTYIKI